MGSCSAGPAATLGVVPESFEPIAAALSIRPMRSVILVPSAGDIPWQAAFRKGLLCHVATWGGCGNLVLPMLTDRDPHEELFWSLLDVYDPDTIHGLPLKVGDVDTFAPDVFRAKYETRKRELLASVPKELEAQAAEDFANRHVVGTDLSGDFQELLKKRLAPLSAVSGMPGFRYDASDPPHWPLTASEKIRPLPDELVLKIGWPTDDLAVMNAGTRGEMSPRLVTELRKAGVKVLALKVDPAGMWMDAVVPGRGAPMWSLAGIGLESSFYSGAEPSGLVLCTGDEPWDLALAVALERLGVSARWAPTYASDELMALHAYATWARRIRTHTGGPDIRVCSTSSAQAADELAGALTRQKRDLAVERCEVLDLVPLSPMRLYEREGVGAWQTMLVIEGQTPHLPTPLPRFVESESTDDIHWMTDVHVENWDGVRHLSLEGVLFAAPALAERNGAKWERRTVIHVPGRVECNLSLARPHDGQAAARAACLPRPGEGDILRCGMASGTLRQRALLAEDGCRFRKCDAANRGFDGRPSAAHDRIPVERPECARMAHRSRRTPMHDAPGLPRPARDGEPGPRRRRPRASRRSHPRHRPEVHGMPLDALLPPDGGWGRLPLRALRRCATPHQRQLDGRPGATLALRTGRGCLPVPKHNGDLPLLAAYDFIVSPAARARPPVRRQLQFTGELLLTDPEGVRSELDIAVTDGSHLWVGEATTAKKLANSAADELVRLERFKKVADLLGARGALLVTSGEWQKTTEGRATAIFPDIWPRLEIVSGARRARLPPPTAEVPDGDER